MNNVTLSFELDIEKAQLVTTFLKVMERSNQLKNPFKVPIDETLKFPKEHEAFEKIRNILEEF